jgi:hypothetical protein
VFRQARHLDYKGLSEKARPGREVINQVERKS